MLKMEFGQHFSYFYGLTANRLSDWLHPKIAWSISSISSSCYLSGLFLGDHGKIVK